MRNPIQVLFAALLLAASLALAGCQGGSTPVQTAGPKKLNAGGEIQANPANNKFVLSGNRGTYTVDMTGATFVRDGKKIEASALKAGAFVLVSGTVEGQTLKASRVQLIHTKDQLPTKPAMAAGSPGG